MSDQPNTAAGRALLDRLGDLPKLMPYDDEARELILAIEAEARQQDGSALRHLVAEHRLAGHPEACSICTVYLAALPPSAPPALDVERLGAAMVLHDGGLTSHPGKRCGRKCATAIAAEYARLQEQDR